MRSARLRSVVDALPLASVARDGENAGMSMRFLDRDAVSALLPPIPDQIDLVGETYLAMARGEVEMPPKIGVHPREDAFLHAMPSYLRHRDVVAVKWVSGYPANPARGLPYISGLIVVNDAETGVPLAVLDAAEITAARTAAASGLCVRRWAPAGWSRAAVLGCGEQGRYHAAMLRALVPGCDVRAYDPVAERAAALCEGVVVCASAREAAAGTDVVVTTGPIVRTPPRPIDASWLGDDQLLLPVDFDFYVSPAAVEACDLFLTDHVDQFRAYRDHGHFNGWPDPAGTVGDGIAGSLSGRRVVCANLGVGALDAAFADVVLRRLERAQ